MPEDRQRRALYTLLGIWRVKANVDEFPSPRGPLLNYSYKHKSPYINLVLGNSRRRLTSLFLYRQRTSHPPMNSITQQIRISPRTRSNNDKNSNLQPLAPKYALQSYTWVASLFCRRVYIIVKAHKNCFEEIYAHFCSKIRLIQLRIMICYWSNISKKQQTVNKVSIKWFLLKYKQGNQCLSN